LVTQAKNGIAGSIASASASAASASRVKWSTSSVVGSRTTGPRAPA